MEKLVENLQECLKTFDMPEVTHKEKDLSFVRKSIEKWKSKYDPNDQMKILSLDSKYFLCDDKDIKEIVKWDWTDSKKYVSNKYDCDNFAFSFKAMVDRKFGLNNVGLVIDYSGGHAYNIVVLANGRGKIFEPQTDGWPRAGTGQYKFQAGSIII